MFPSERRPPDQIERSEVRVQRRLLLSFTFLLAAIHGLEVTIGKSISVQGLVLDMEHPKLLIVALWAGWLWSIWRYWQHERLYSSATFHDARRVAYDQIARKAIFSALERAVEAGTYSSRGLRPGQKFHTSPIEGNWISTSDESGEVWSFPNIEVWIVADSPDTKNRKLEGGANCTFSREEAATLKRDVERELRLRHPHFADVKLPYALAAIAPVAGLIDLSRHCWPAIMTWLGL